MWSFLSVVHPLRIPIPMCEKKIWVQQEICTKLLIVYVYFQHILAIHTQIVNGLKEPFSKGQSKLSRKKNKAEQ
jgi:hypothetical protein